MLWHRFLGYRFNYDALVHNSVSRRVNFDRGIFVEVCFHCDSLVQKVDKFVICVTPEKINPSQVTSQ